MFNRTVKEEVFVLWCLSSGGWMPPVPRHYCQVPWSDPKSSMIPHMPPLNGCVRHFVPSSPFASELCSSVSHVTITLSICIHENVIHCTSVRESQHTALKTFSIQWVCELRSHLFTLSVSHVQDILLGVGNMGPLACKLVSGRLILPSPVLTCPHVQLGDLRHGDDHYHLLSSYCAQGTHWLKIQPCAQGLRVRLGS